MNREGKHPKFRDREALKRAAAIIAEISLRARLMSVAAGLLRGLRLRGYEIQGEGWMNEEGLVKRRSGEPSLFQSRYSIIMEVGMFPSQGVIKSATGAK